MTSQLKNIVHFVVSGVSSVTLPHHLQINGRGVVPDVITPSILGVGTVTADDTNVTVSNSVGDPLMIDVLCEYWHSLERVFGAHSVQHLTPQPFTFNPVLGVAVFASAHIRVTAHTDNLGAQTYSSSVIRLTGGVTYGGLDTSNVAGGYLKVILTLIAPIPDSKKIPQPGIQFPVYPPGPVGETVFLYVPPIPLQGVSDADASMLMPIFGKGVLNTDEIVDVTYNLLVVPT